MNPGALPVIFFYVGKRIREVREATGMSQDQVAERSHLRRTNLTMIELGKQRIQLDDLYRIAMTLAVEPGYLLPPVSAKYLLSKDDSFMEYLKHMED